MLFRCSEEDYFYLFILFLFLFFGADLTFILKPIWHGADLTWGRFDLGPIWLWPIWLGPILLGADLTWNPTNHHSTKIASPPIAWMLFCHMSFTYYGLIKWNILTDPTLIHGHLQLQIGYISLSNIFHISVSYIFLNF